MESPGVKEISRSALVSVLFAFLGQPYRGIRLTETGLDLLGGRPREILFSELVAPLKLGKTLWFGSIVLSLADDSVLEVAGLNNADIKSFMESANEVWKRIILERFEDSWEELSKLSEVVQRLEQPRRYPSACLLEPFAKRADALVATLPKVVSQGLISLEQQQKLKSVVDFQSAPEEERSRAIKSFVGSELAEMKDFFDTIESNPLTPEQRLAVVTDEDATLVLAGAGSGKTSVIVAKASYLIQRAIRQPSEILLMAFGKDAAQEMASRIEERCGSPVDALTFHALGYGIIREVEGKAPPLAPHASDDAQYRALLRDILVTDIATKEHFKQLLIRWFTKFFWPYKNEWDFKTKDEYYQYVEAQELRTLQGERVRSFEECEIANWLYLNSIAYEYEPIYEHELSDSDRRAYLPDFRLTESGIYIEHFGVRKAKGPDGLTRLETRPDIDRECYLEGMDWKRALHKEHGTTLIETYSYERVEGRLTEELEKKLAPYLTPEPIPSEKVFKKLNEMGQIDAFTQTLGTFLRHFKSSRLTIDRCRQRADESEEVARSSAFLKVFECFLHAYQHRLGDRIDFEDMISLATDHVEAGRYQSPYRHLLVDEFQDISEGRARLLRALKAQHADARIFAVGDDWQSIYRFAGADIHLMRGFGHEFGGAFARSTGVHNSVDLGRTFRSVDKIAFAARSFVLKNPMQIRKQVIPAGTADAPAIKVIYYTLNQESESLNEALDEIQKTASMNGKSSVLLLGRYRFVKPEKLDRLESGYPNLSVQFKTVHASKGLEADHIIILRAESDRLGFPSEIVDDPLLNLVLPEPENYSHAEERRLFYVALTRARKTVTILADREMPSVFVRELIDCKEYGVIELGTPGVAVHRCGKCGGRMLADKSKRGRISFACEHRFLCGNTLKPCAVCQNDLPFKDSSDPTTLVCSCGSRFPVCPECSDGWLVERKGRFGKFLGCVNYPACKGSRKL